MAQILQLTHKELVFLLSNLVVEAKKEVVSVNEQNMYSTGDGTPGPLQYLNAILNGGEHTFAPEGSEMAKTSDEYYRRNGISQTLNSEWNKDFVTSKFRRLLNKESNFDNFDNPKSLLSITRKLYPKKDDLWVSQQVVIELILRQQRANRKLGFKTIMGYDEEKSVESGQEGVVNNERQQILKSGGYIGLSPFEMLEKLFNPGSGRNIEATELDAVFTTLAEEDIDIRALLSDTEKFIKWQKTNPQQKEFFKEMPQFTANIGIPPALVEGIQDLITLYQAPFKNSKEGNAFRNWMSELFPAWRAVDGDKLDKKGSYKNSWINQAWRDYGVMYTDVTKDHELLSYTDWLKKNKLKDNPQMAGYYKDYLKGDSYRHDDIKHGEYINPTAPIYTVTGGANEWKSPWIRGGSMPSCVDCHAFIGSGWSADNKPNFQQQMFMASNGLNFPAYDAQMRKAYDIVNNFSDYAAQIPAVKWFMDDGYHLLIDICSFVCYILCPFSYGVGCAASVGFDILNAYAYVNWDDKKDYYSAGLQLAFAIVPGGELIKILAKRLKPTLTPFFKMCMTGAPSKKTIIDMVATVSAKQKILFREIIGPFIHYFPSKSAVSAMETILQAWLRSIKPYTTAPLYNIAKEVTSWALRNFRWWIFLVEQMFYDPGQSLFTLVGDLSGKYVPQLGLESYTDKLKDWPKVGLGWYNWILERYDLGGMEAIVQTSIEECQNKVYSTRYSQAYDYEKIKENWKTSKTSSADPYIKDRLFWEGKDKDKTFSDKAKNEQKNGFKTKEDNNLREYGSAADRMEPYAYTPINGEWHRRLKDSPDDEWINLTPKGDLWDEDKFRDDWFEKGWRPTIGLETEAPAAGEEITEEVLAEIMGTNIAVQQYKKFKTCKALMEETRFKKYFDDCKLFISIWIKSQEQDSEENEIRTAMDLVWDKHCK